MRKSCLLSILILACFSVTAQTGYTPSADNLRSREEFLDARFGLFVHWGLYSMLGDGEWVMNNKNIDYREYAKLAGGFYPSKFDAAAWVAAAKNAGMKYICITSRHHDGFSMFGSDCSDFNIRDATPFGRDVIGELAEECRRQGMRLHFYYSQLDWSREDYLPAANSGQGTGRSGPGDFDHYVDFMCGQLTELLTRYGPVGAIWFDGWWDKPEAHWQLDRVYGLIHSLQPACLVGSNHHREPHPGEDFQMFERDLPGQNTAGHSAGQTVGPLPLETCQTMNGTWGYSITDRNYRTTEELIRYLVRAAGNNANLLLNVGPQPDGRIPDAALERMRGIGEWMAVYGETIYGTRGGDIPPADWGVTTRRGDRLYVHILDRKTDTLTLALDPKSVRSAVLFRDKSPVRFTKGKDGIVLRTALLPEDTDCVVELAMKPGK